MVSLHMMHYNFVLIHQTLRCTPAMAAGVSTTLWELSDIVKRRLWEADQNTSDLSEATRNVPDFQSCGVEVVNFWEAASL